MTRIVRRRRLLTIGHSYAVAVNRRLAQAIAARGDWDVTVAAPGRFRGDFREHVLRAVPGERFQLEPLPALMTRPVHVMLYGRRLRDLLQEPWDLVHCWEEPYVAAAGQVAAWTPAGVPLVFATFQNIAKRYPPPFNWIERRTLARADGLIAFGETVRAVLATRHPRPARVRMIPPGVDTQRFAPDGEAGRRVRQSLGWSDRPPVVGFLGRFVAEKGVGWLTGVLDAIAHPWRALFVGSGPLESELRQWASRRPNQVAIETGVAHDDVPQWLNAMDLLCAPSLTTGRWREQFGRMLIEAFACGVPVVASSSGEIPHVVGDAGIVAPEGDVRRWQDAITSLLDDEQARRTLGERGRRRALAHYDWHSIAGQHAAFFDEVLASRPAVPASA
jgi:glycosyltransferase involved in cell wall biosynthesis